MSNAKFIKAPEPTFGQVILAKRKAEEIYDDLNAGIIAAEMVYRDMDQYGDRVRAGQVKLRELARLLGYEIVPARVREPVDA